MKQTSASQASLRSVLRAIGALAGCALAGCAGTTPAEDAARAGDLTALRRAIADDARSGKLDDERAADIANASAAGDLVKAKGWRGAQDVLSWQACARDVEDALDERGDEEDDPAAAALWLLVSVGEEDADDFVDGDAEDVGGSAWWRSLGARGLTDDDDAGTRRIRMRDGEERVRLGAIKAADEALDPGDVDALVEVARLDPLPAARSGAVYVLGHLGGERAVRGLRDVWTRADARLRQNIASAWGTQRAYPAGGERELLRAAEQESGEIAVAAAVTLARAGGKHAAFARQALARSIEEGTRGERVFSVAASPPGPQITAALRKASKDRDIAVAAAALARLAREGDDKDKRAATEELLKLAKSDGADARMARGELARAGDVRALPLAEKAISAKSATDRMAGARDLAALGRAHRAASLLADDDRDVRVAAACAILGASR